MADRKSQTKQLEAIAAATVTSANGAAVTTANPMPSQPVMGGAAASAANPVPTQQSVGGAVVSAANPVPVQPSIGNAVVSAANPVPIKDVGGGVPVSVAGRVVAPAAAAVIADTGALAAGNYRVSVVIGTAGVAAAGKGASFQHRDAANGANVSEGPIVGMGSSVSFEIPKLVVALNERLRVVQDSVAAAAAETVGARITATPI